MAQCGPFNVEINVSNVGELGIMERMALIEKRVTDIERVLGVPVDLIGKGYTMQDIMTEASNRQFMAASDARFGKTVEDPPQG